MKWKKSGIIGNENAAHNSLYIRKDIGMNIISEYLKQSYCQEYSMKYIYSTSQMSKLSLTLCTFSITGLVAGLFLTVTTCQKDN